MTAVEEERQHKVIKDTLMKRVTHQQKLHGEIKDVRVMTVKEAAGRLGIPLSTTYRLAKEGQLPVVPLGRRLLIPRLRFDEMLRGVWKAELERKS